MIAPAGPRSITRIMDPRGAISPILRYLRARIALQIINLMPENSSNSSAT